MHFFFGKIKKFKEPKGDAENPNESDVWNGEKLMTIKRAIEIIEKNKPFPKGNKKYYNIQLKFLNDLKKRK